MADTALKENKDSGKAERLCKWCGVLFLSSAHNAKFCSKQCGRSCRYAADPEKHKAYSARWKAMNAPNTGAFQKKMSCEFCSEEFVAGTSTRKFCSIQCKEKKRYQKHREGRKERQREMRKASPDHVRRIGRAGYYRMKEERPEDWKRFCDNAAAASKRWRARDPEYARSRDREGQRRRAAQSALSAILLPVQEHPEV